MTLRSARRRGARGSMLQEGMRLGRYELVECLASGGMADVWIARQLGDFGFVRTVAVKTIRPAYSEEHSFRRMLLDEARIASRIRHANVVDVVDVGESDDTVFLVMALVDGVSLSALRAHARRLDARGGLPPSIAVRIVSDVAAGLHAAHELTDEDDLPLEIVHRDVSPQNILVGLDGVAKITDFGIAKVVRRYADDTDGAELKGKLAYLSPEQADRRPVDRRSDVFSLGIVLWEVLTGVRLFGGDAVDVLQKIPRDPIPDPRTLVSELPPLLAEVTLRALARDPGARFPTAAALREALEGVAKVHRLAASAQDVAQLVEELAGDELRERRAVARQAARQGPLPSPKAEIDPPAGGAAAPEVRPAVTTGGKRVAIGLAFAAALIGGAMALGASGSGPRVHADGAPPVDSTPAPPAAPTPPAVAPAASEADAAVESPPGVVQPPAHEATPAPRRTPAASSKPTSTSIESDSRSYR